MAVEDGRLVRDGRPYRGVGVNYFDLFIRILHAPTNTSSLAGLKKLAAENIYPIVEPEDPEPQNLLPPAQTLLPQTWKKLADEKKIEADKDTEGYPPTLEDLVKGVEIEDKDAKGQGSGRKRIVRFLRRVPIDPMTHSFDWGLRSYQDDPDDDVWGEENVYDVYTKSPAKALDGTFYKDW